MAADLILSIDTSGVDAGIAIEGDDFVDMKLLPLGSSGHARTEDLASELASMLASRGREARDIVCIGAVVGPGSYTGLRSGLAFVRGLAFADSLATVRVTTLELLAWRASKAGESIVVASAVAEGRHAIGAFRRFADSLEAVGEEVVVDGDEAAALLESHFRGGGFRVFAGAGRGDAPTVAGPGTRDIDAAARSCGFEVRLLPDRPLESLAALVAVRASRRETVRAADLLPTYVGQSSARPNRARVALLDVPK